MDDFSAAVDRLCGEAEALPVDVLDALAVECAGGPLDEVGVALARVGRLRVSGRRHAVGRLLLVRALVGAHEVDDVMVAEMVGSSDGLWRAAGDALDLVRQRPWECGELSAWGLG